MWTPALKSKALNLYVNEKLSMRAVAEKLDCSHSAVQKLVESEGVVRKKTEHVKANGKWSKPFKFTKPVVDKLKRLYIEKGWPFSKIGAKYGWPDSVIEAYFRERGWTHSYAHAAKLRAAIKNNKAIAKHSKAYPLIRSKYRKTCVKLAYCLWLKHKSYVDPQNKKKVNSGYEIDHKFSVRDGYDNLLPMAVINHPFNLRIITRERNNIKGEKSILSLRQLLEGILDYDEKNGSPFKIQ